MIRVLLISLIYLAAVTGCNTQRHANTPASDLTSGIASIALSEKSLHNLTNLGMLWGFIKYHHPSVCKGNNDMDAELFAILPEVLSAANAADANRIMEKWVDHFGEVAECPDLNIPSAEVKLQPDYGYLFDPGNLPKTLQEKLERIRRYTKGRRSSYYVSSDPDVGNPEIKNERPYATSYPDAGLRLLALYRYWNIIQYYFPNRHLIGEDWNKVLTDMLPDFCNAADRLHYVTACKRLIVHINDSHGWISEGDSTIQKFGEKCLPVCASFIENKVVITGYDTAVLKDEIACGDVVERINYIPVEARIGALLPVTSGSNHSRKMFEMLCEHGSLFRSDVPVTMQVNRNGKTRMVSLPPYRAAGIDRLFVSNKGFKMLAGNIGYIYPRLLTNKDFDSVKTLMNDAKGIIIDFRCYPKSVFMPFTYGAWLKKNRSEFVRFTVMKKEVPGMFTYSRSLTNGLHGSDHYKGKVVIIVNSETMSSAEYQTMALSSPGGGIVIGDTTSGADGNISVFDLPGNISTALSGIGILYPDGRESQRIGVKIDRIVKPTIKGIMAHRDEQLEAAIEYIREN